jgi:NADH-quinone oxidoreductase subunit G
LHFRDNERLSNALDKLDLLVVLDFVHSEIAKRADILIPTETLFEAGGVFINNEGRAQMIHPVYRGGVPISQVGAGGHPPRDYAAGSGGGDSLPAWLALACLADRTAEPERDLIRKEILGGLAEVIPALAALPPIDDFPAEGVRLLSGTAGEDRFLSEWPDEPARRPDDETLTLLPVASTFGTVDLSILSPCLRALGDAPRLYIHPSDAQNLGLSEGDQVSLQLDGGSVEVTMHVRDNMAAGFLIMPRNRRLAHGPVRKMALPLGRIVKVG